MILSHRYRLLPRKRQHRALESILESQRQLYNAALEERTGAYRRGVVRSYFDPSRELTVWRQSDPEARALPVSLQRSTLKRLDAAYRAFFRRVKAGGDRWHECRQCGLCIDRDLNAARNILFRAGVGPGLPNVAG